MNSVPPLWLRRVRDVANEPTGVHLSSPFSGLSQAARLPLAACVSLAAPDVLRMTGGAGSHVEASVSLAESVMTAELHADALLTHQKTYGIKEPLDREQIAAIHLATQDGVFRQSLDVALRSGVSPSLPVPNHDSPFAPFLRLLISGLARLPPCADICFRGAPGAECASHCRMHTSLIWWTLSETTSSAEALAPPPPPPLSVADAIAAAAYESDDDSDAYYSGDSSLSSSPEVSPLRSQLSLSPSSRPNMSQLRLRLPSSENLFIPASPPACNDGRPVRTLFSIVTRYAVDVRRYVAHIAKGCELMLLPGARLEVKSVKRILGDNAADEEHVWLVQLEERQPPLCLSEYEARDSAGRPLSSYPLSPTAQRSRSVAPHLKSVTVTPHAAVNVSTGSTGLARSSSAPDLETPRQSAVQDLRSSLRYAHESPQYQQKSPAPPTPTFHAISIDACEAMDSIRAGDRAFASADYRLAAKHFQHAATLATGMTGNASVSVAAADLTAVALGEWAHCHITATLHALWGRPACSLGANRSLDDPAPDDDDAASAVERSSGVGCVAADESDLIHSQMCAAVVTAASRSHERGCSLGASALARCAYYGIGMPADGARAFTLYTEAARSYSDGQVGVAWAYCGLGLCALHGVGRARDVQHALALFQRGIDTVTSIDITSTSRPFAGRSAAAACEHHLALACLHGMTGSARNAASAVASLVRAVQLGGSHAPALHRLAACARAGIGCTRDDARAGRLFIRASDTHGDCAFQYARCLARAGDSMGAWAMVERAAMLGHPEAYFRIALETRNRAKRDGAEKSAVFFERAARGGHAAASVEFGLWIVTTAPENAGQHECDVVEAEAEHWFERAARQDNVDALYHLATIRMRRAARMSEAHPDLNPIRAACVKMLSTAAERGHPAAMCALGQYYRSVKERPSLMRAQYWLEKGALAIPGGNIDCAFALAQCLQDLADLAEHPDLANQHLIAAVKLYRAVLRANPMHATAASALAHILELSNRMEDQLESRYLMRRAAELGCARAQVKVASQKW